MIKTLNGTYKHTLSSVHLNGADMTITTWVQFLNDPQRPLQPWGPLILDEDHWPNLQTVLKQRTSVGWQRTEILFNPQMPKLLHKVIAVTQTQWEVIGTGIRNLWRTCRFGTGLPTRKWEGVSGTPASRSSPTKVRGWEFNIPSISTRIVSSSTLVRDLLPTDFLKELLTHLINRSHQPPHHWARGAMNFHSGPSGPSTLSFWTEAALNPFALSDMRTEGIPRRDENRRHTTPWCKSSDCHQGILTTQWGDKL